MAKGKKGGKKDKGDKADGVPPPAQVKTGIDKLSAEQKVKTDGKCNGMVYDDQVDWSTTLFNEKLLTDLLTTAEISGKQDSQRYITRGLVILH